MYSVLLFKSVLHRLYTDRHNYHLFDTSLLNVRLNCVSVCIRSTTHQIVLGIHIHRQHTNRSSTYPFCGTTRQFMSNFFGEKISLFFCDYQSSVSPQRERGRSLPLLNLPHDVCTKNNQNNTHIAQMGRWFTVYVCVCAVNKTWDREREQKISWPIPLGWLPHVNLFNILFWFACLEHTEIVHPNDEWWLIGQEYQSMYGCVYELYSRSIQSFPFEGELLVDSMSLTLFSMVLTCP